MPIPSQNRNPFARSRRPLAALLLLLALAGLFPVSAWAKGATDDAPYDVLYIWDADLNNLQDYKEELEVLLGDGVGKKLRIIAKGNKFGIIYDRNGTAISSARVAIRHSALLAKAGLGGARAIRDEGYDELYNVCYGHGPNLEALKRHYQTVYRQLGADVGKDLVIEHTDDGKYTLLYRRQGDKESSAVIARKHAKLLAGTHISASITREDNNEVVFGEASYLDDEEEGSKGNELKHKTIAITGKKPLLAEVRKKAVTTKRPSPPAELAEESKKSVVCLTDSANTNLEKQLEGYIQKLRHSGQIASDEQTGWLVIDLTKGETLVDINVDSPYQAASMIKPFIALAFFHRVQEGKLSYGPQSRKKMAAMIQHSSNSATNWVLKQVGGPSAAQKILKKHYGHLLRETSLVEYIPAGGCTYRNKASAKDYGRFLVALWEQKLPQSKELRRLMALPGRDRLYYGTPIPRGTLVYNKTGSTAKLCGDMGILAPRAKNGRRYPYVVVGIIEKKQRAGNYGLWKMVRSNVIRGASTMIYESMKKNYNLL